MIDIPASGQKYHTTFKVTLRDKTVYELPVVDLNYSKDITGPTGDGSVTIPNLYDLYKKLYYNQEFLVRGAWLESNETPNNDKLLELFKGTVESVKRSGLNIEIEFKDKGKLLEKQDSVSFTQKKRSEIIREIIKKAGLKPNIDFGSQPDDIIDYTSASNTGSGSGCISGQSYPTSGCEAASWSLHSFSWKNYCPACKKEGTLRKAGYGDLAYKGPPIGDSDCSGINCSECDSDYCPVTGWETSGKCLYKLEKCDSASSGASMPADISGMPSGVAGDTSTTMTETTQSSSKTYWDMIIELCDPMKLDLQVFVWIDTCYVMEVPGEDTAVLVADDRENVHKDSVTINSTKPVEETGTGGMSSGTSGNELTTSTSNGNETSTAGMVPNVVIVNYGNKTYPQKVEARFEDSIQMLGEIKQYYDRYDLDAESATSFANKMLNKLNRENPFSIDLTVIGHPEFFVGRWVNTILTRYNYNDRLYAKVCKLNLSATNVVKNDLNLVSWYPLINVQKAGGADLSTLDAIGREEAKFGSAQNVCSNARCFEQLGTGDCWADSEWLYNKLNEAGIPARIMGNRDGTWPKHTWVEINTGNGWETYPYSKYGSKHVGIPSGVGQVFVLIPEGHPPANILATGY